ncbi:uncharacterized protein V6R79_019614 [Siganus canaliculatus]
MPKLNPHHVNDPDLPLRSERRSLRGGRELDLRGTSDLGARCVKGHGVPHTESLSTEAWRRWERDCGLVVVLFSFPFVHWETQKTVEVMNPT